MAELNLETFKELLFGALKPEAKKSEVAGVEIVTALALRDVKLVELFGELKKLACLPVRVEELMKEIATIEGNIEYLDKVYSELTEGEE